jgi:hypothetical protein
MATLNVLPTMELLVDVPEPLVGDVGVDLGGRHVFVAQQLLDDDSGVIAPTIPEISRPPIPGLSRPPVPELCRPSIPELFRPPVEAA